jgi:hypothetical protein
MKQDHASNADTRLRLQKETLRTLLDDELDDVAGGNFIDTGSEYGNACWYMAAGPSGSGGGAVGDY